MKYILIAIILVSFSLNAQELIDNEGVKRQVESTVVTEWSKTYFRPKLFYRIVYNRYRTGRDRRLIREIAPQLALVKLTKEQTELEEESVNKDYVDELATDFDKRVNLHYNMLYKDVFDNLFFKLDYSDIRSHLNVLEGFEGNPFKESDHLLAVENFRERHKVIYESYQSSHLKNTDYDELIKDMEEHLKILELLKIKLKVYNKYKSSIIEIKD